MSMTTKQDLKKKKKALLHKHTKGMLYSQVLCLNMHRKFNHGLKQPYNWSAEGNSTQDSCYFCITDRETYILIFSD